VAERIEFRCGASTFTVNADGSINLSGVEITVNGESFIKAKASRIDLN